MSLDFYLIAKAQVAYAPLQKRGVPIPRVLAVHEMVSSLFLLTTLYLLLTTLNTPPVVGVVAILLYCLALYGKSRAIDRHSRAAARFFDGDYEFRKYTLLASVHTFDTTLRRLRLFGLWFLAFCLLIVLLSSLTQSLTLFWVSLTLLVASDAVGDYADTVIPIQPDKKEEELPAELVETLT